MNTRNFALTAGVIFLLIGVLGFLPGLRSMVPAHAPPMNIESGYGYLFGLFPVNILHNIVHIAIGIWGLVTYRSFSAAKIFAKGLAIIYGVLAVMGFIPGLSSVGGLVPLFGHDIWLHGVTAAIAAYFGFARVEETSTQR